MVTIGSFKSGHGNVNKNVPTGLIVRHQIDRRVDGSPGAFKAVQMPANPVIVCTQGFTKVYCLF